MQMFMRRILLLSLLAALVAVAAPGTAWAGANAAGTSRPVECTEGREHAKAIRPQLLCIRTSPPLRKAGPPPGESSERPAAVIADALDFDVRRRVAIARVVRAPPSVRRMRTHSPRAPPAAA